MAVTLLMLTKSGNTRKSQKIDRNIFSSRCCLWSYGTMALYNTIR